MFIPCNHNANTIKKQLWIYSASVLTNKDSNRSRKCQLWTDWNNTELNAVGIHRPIMY